MLLFGEVHRLIGITTQGRMISGVVRVDGNATAAMYHYFQSFDRHGFANGSQDLWHNDLNVCWYVNAREYQGKY